MVHTSVTSVYETLKQVVLKVIERIQYPLYVHQCIDVYDCGIYVFTMCIVVCILYAYLAKWNVEPGTLIK